MKGIAVFLSILIVVMVGCAVMSGVSDPHRSEPAGEVFEGTAQGYRGPITVQVWVDKGAITEIVVESREDRNVGATAIEELIDIVIENNSTDVDVISGATVSSKGFLEAVNRAIINHE